VPCGRPDSNEPGLARSLRMIRSTIATALLGVDAAVALVYLCQELVAVVGRSPDSGTASFPPLSGKGVAAEAPSGRVLRWSPALAIEDGWRICA
jgi:hypothetical protein